MADDEWRRGRSRSGVAFERRGCGAPVLLLHGVPGSGRSWDQVSVRLEPDHDVIVVDLLGFGASERPTELATLHAEGQAAAVAGLLDELGLRGITVVAHDFGGPTAVVLADRRPDLVGRLALFASNAFTDTPIPPPLNTVTWPVIGRITSLFLFSKPSLAMVIRTGTGAPKPRIDVAAALGDAGQTRAIRTIFHGSLTRLRSLYRPVEDALGRLDVPTVVGWGGRDPFFTVAQGRRTAAALPRAEFVLYDGAGHFLPEERPDELAATIRELTNAGAGRV